MKMLILWAHVPTPHMADQGQIWQTADSQCLLTRQISSRMVYSVALKSVVEIYFSDTWCKMFSLET